MTEQEKIEIFANYLPYKVQMAVFDEQYKDGYIVKELVGLCYVNRYKPFDLSEDEQHLKGVKEIKYWFSDYGLNSTVHVVKPILRPLSDITKPIKVDGYNDSKEFVPIVELAKIGQTFQSQSIDNWEVTKVSKDFGYGHNQYYVQFKDNYVFGYHEKHGFYSSSNRNKEMDINNQKELWKMLYKWHVDIHGLIEKNIAVDINTLK